MAHKPAFLSTIIQCCPDPERQERINIGVVTLSPENQQWGVLLAELPPLALYALSPACALIYGRLREELLNHVSHTQRATQQTSERFALEMLDLLRQPREQMVRFTSPSTQLGASLSEVLIRTYQRCVSAALPAESAFHEK